MKFFRCECGAALFFHNSVCLTCGKDVGFCPVCREMTALVDESKQGAEVQTLRCGRAACGAELFKCHNFVTESVCNWCVERRDLDGAVSNNDQQLCSSCQLTQVIPDLTLPGNRRRWAELEQAKRRLLYTLDLLSLPYADEQNSLPLRFEFKGDPIVSKNWQPIGVGDQVTTGHADGVITINICEADSIQREQTRVQLGEELRTLIGHFRHEVGHYYWQRLVKGQIENKFVEVFGDHQDPPYEQAKQAYYANGPVKDWRLRFVSAYASMHPWEDFAETFATYLDVAALLDTAGHAGLIQQINIASDIDAIVESYEDLGVGINELNREMGLLDPVPTVLSAEVIGKLRFIHQLIHGDATT